VLKSNGAQQVLGAEAQAIFDALPKVDAPGK
jgi:hypothetical protein